MIIIYYILSILIFTIFDIIGYYYILTKKETERPPKIKLYSYRLLQGILQLGIIVLIYFIDFRLAMVFIISWWLGACDALYYVFTLRNVWRLDNMTWLWWTPYGIIINFINKLSKKNIGITGKQLYIFAIIGVIISYIILGGF